MEKEFFCMPDAPVVETKEGKLRGFRYGTTYTFHGIKYADAKRFEMPTRVQAWEGVRDALAYGYICPTMRRAGVGDNLRVPHRFWPQDEDCQYLNIWTQSLDREAKKPVMVWLHGGGFDDGSSLEMMAYDGDALSVFGDVVVVNLNHRLNILGYFDVSAFGEKYWNSGNAGVADLVTALEWVRDNIAGFGGDPDNVTIFGQSGGGGKTCTLLQTPAADGLFHRAIAQSGIHNLRAPMDHETSTEAAKRMIEYTGCADFEAFAKIPYAAMVEAFYAVTPEMKEEGYTIPFGFAPHANGWYLGDARFFGFSEHAKQVPLMVGSVFAEYSRGPRPDGLTEEEQAEKVKLQFGKETGEKIIPLFKKGYPDKPLVDVCSLDSMVRFGSLDHVMKRAEFTDAPVYTYLFTLKFDYDGGTPPWHCAEVPFVFHNTDLVPICSMPGVTKRLEEQVASAWVNFARYGNPNNPTLPEWPAYTADHRATMLFDRTCEVRFDHDRELIGILRTAPSMRVGGMAAMMSAPVPELDRYWRE